MFRSITLNYTEHLLIDAAEYAISSLSVAYSTPMEFQNKIYHKKTVCLLERSVMETIVTAAKEEGFVVSATSQRRFFRVRNIWDDEGMALLSTKKRSVLRHQLVAGMYSPIRCRRCSTKSLS